jgi:rhamnogalacturonan hydrolase
VPWALSGPALVSLPFLCSIYSAQLINSDISNIIYRNIYTANSNQMYMLKSNGGSGTVKNCQFSNFIGHSNAYTLDLNAFWSSEKVQTGSGVQYSNITFDNWKGTCSDGTKRAPMNVICPADVPCTGITITDFEVWTESGSSVLWKCENAFGTGGCLDSGDVKTYSAVSTIKAAP